MQGFDRPRETSGSRALGNLAMVLAFIAAFLLTPVFHGETVNWAVGYIYANYWAWLADLGWYIWFVLSAFLTFFLSLVLIIGLLNAGKLLSSFGLLSRMR